MTPPFPTAANDPSELRGCSLVGSTFSAITLGSDSAADKTPKIPNSAAARINLGIISRILFPFPAHDKPSSPSPHFPAFSCYDHGVLSSVARNVPRAGLLTEVAL